MLFGKRGIALFALFTLCGTGFGALGNSFSEKDLITTTSSEILTSATLYGENTSNVLMLQPVKPVEYLGAQMDSLPSMNREVVKLMLEYPRDGKHGYWWPKTKAEGSYDGATTDVIVNGILAMRGEPKRRSFCCGLTLEVFWRMMEKQNQLPGAVTSGTADILKKLWFCRSINSPGPEDALLAFGIGEKVANADDARPGDFVQIWRNNKSGHSVMFVKWAYDKDGKRVGLHYWSTQPGTDGIAFTTELFGKFGRSVNEEKLSISRLLPPDKWRKVTPEQVLASVDTPTTSSN